MLVYARRTTTKPVVLSPPPLACDFIHKLNTIHENALNLYDEKYAVYLCYHIVPHSCPTSLQTAKARFSAHYRNMQAFLQCWSVASSDQVRVLIHNGRVSTTLTCWFKSAIIASKQGLQTFISRLEYIRWQPNVRLTAENSIDLAGPSQKQDPSSIEEALADDGAGRRTPSSKLSPIAEEISISDIVCEHGKLDPSKSADMKRVNAVRLLSTFRVIR